MSQIVKSKPVFDAIVVGSGATGGWAAKQLTEAGMSVVLLEAGSKVTPADFTEHVQPYQLKYRSTSDYFSGPSKKPPIVTRDRPVQSLCYACRESNYKWFVNDIENPYTTPDGKPFHWIRMRALGGRTLSWSRQAYRFSDLDFKAASHDGFGEDWPVSYEEMAPHYETVERFIGLSGQEERLPQPPDSVFLPPMEMTCGEKIFKKSVESKTGRTVTIGRVAILTKAHNGRQPCHYCGPCEQGCSTFSYFSSPFTTIAAAAATGRLTLITDAVTRRVLRDPATGLAAGVEYVDRESRDLRDIRAKAVVLCASTLESTRLLLNSETGGLANSSGVLGHYLMDHLNRGAIGMMPMIKANAWSGAPSRPNGIYIPRFRNVKEKQTNGFIRGYGMQGGSSPGFAMQSPGFGANFKEAVRDKGMWATYLAPFCECLPRFENFVELDKEKVDAWGVPVLRIQMQWSDNERAMSKDASQQAQEMLTAAGAKPVFSFGGDSVPGLAIHEVGTARMGGDPKKSILNAHCQTHDIKNLFVTDGAAFVSSACQNPTLTMMANTVRASAYLIEQARKGELA